MDRNSFISNFKKNTMNRVPKAFMLFLVLALIIECGIHLLSPCIVANSAYLPIQARIKVTSTKNLDRGILIFGDSTAGVGINPQRLREDTGLACANLATRAGTTIAANYFLLQDYLKSNKPPKQIILMRTFKGWPGNPGNRAFELLLANFPGEMPELLAHPRLIGNNYGTLLGKIPIYLLPSQRNRLAIQRIALKVIKNKKQFPRF